jgi:hypothetical protein
MFNGKDHSCNVCLIGTTIDMSYVSDREDHMLNGKDQNHDMYLMGKATCLMGKTRTIICI